METLRNKLLDIHPDITLDECNKLFSEIAEMLFENYAVQNGSKIYRLTELEFYYYNSNIEDKREDNEDEKVTYERTTPAGCWFFHNSGIDISFQSNKDKCYGGGILIRGIKQVLPEEATAISGPKLSYWEMFDDYTDAFSSTTTNPHLILYKSDKVKFDVSERKGLENKDKFHRKWRFYIKGIR